MIPSSASMRLLIVLLTIVSLALAKFTDKEIAEYKSPMDENHQREFEPLGRKIMESCWIEGYMLPNATLFGMLTDCFPHKWYCTLDSTRLLTRHYENVNCIEMDAWFNPTEYLCSYRWFNKRPTCKTVHVDCYFAQFACEQKYFGFKTNILFPISTIISLVVFILVCVVFACIHYRLYRRHSTSFKSWMPKLNKTQETTAFFDNTPVQDETDNKDFPQIGKTEVAVNAVTPV